MKGLRILIVEDQPQAEKCLRLVRFLKEQNIEYDIATNLEDALNKLFSSKKENYNCIVLDRYFPEKREGKAEGKAAIELLDILEEKSEISILLYSIFWENVSSKNIKKQMALWNSEEFQDFLESSTN